MYISWILATATIVGEISTGTVAVAICVGLYWPQASVTGDWARRPNHSAIIRMCAVPRELGAGAGAGARSAATSPCMIAANTGISATRIAARPHA